MSVPHTGRLTAQIDGLRATFNGERWFVSDSNIEALLNSATFSSPKTHFDIKSLAEHVLTKAGLKARARILEWKADEWPDDLPDGVID
jgi:hypothetical protein